MKIGECMCVSKAWTGKTKRPEGRVKKWAKCQEREGGKQKREGQSQRLGETEIGSERQGEGEAQKSKKMVSEEEGRDQGEDRQKEGGRGILRTRDKGRERDRDQQKGRKWIDREKQRGR